MYSELKEELKFIRKSVASSVEETRNLKAKIELEKTKEYERTIHITMLFSIACLFGISYSISLIPITATAILTKIVSKIVHLKNKKKIEERISFLDVNERLLENEYNAVEDKLIKQQNIKSNNIGVLQKRLEMFEQQYRREKISDVEDKTLEDFCPVECNALLRIKTKLLQLKDRQDSLVNLRKTTYFDYDSMITTIIAKIKFVLNLGEYKGLEKTIFSLHLEEKLLEGYYDDVFSYLKNPSAVEIANLDDEFITKLCLLEKMVSYYIENKSLIDNLYMIGQMSELKNTQAEQSILMQIGNISNLKRKQFTNKTCGSFYE